MKFDIIVGNPPYGEDKKGSNRFLHLQIMNTLLKFCLDKLVFIMPSKPIIKQLDDRWYNMFKNAVCNNVEIVKKETFSGTEMDNIAIYYCDRNDDPKNYCKKFDVDNIIYNVIDDDSHKLFIDKMCKDNCVKILIPYNLHGHRPGSEYFESEIKRIYDKLKSDCYYLNVNRFSAMGTGQTWFSDVLWGVDVLMKDDEIDFCKKHIKQKNIIECPTKEYGENLKNLMKNGFVLRYSLWLTQIRQYIVKSQFKYVPDLDYTNIHTDEELLAACGFTPDEIEKVMKYLENFDFSKSRNDLIRDYEI